MFFQGRLLKKQQNSRKKPEKNDEILELEKTSPKFHQNSDLGGSWALFGEGLGRSWASFGHFWALLGRFFGVLKSTFFKHVPAWAQDGLQEASGIDFGPIFHGFGDGLGGVWKGIWKNFEPLSK